MEFHWFLRRAMTCTEDELIEWIFRLEQEEIALRCQSITNEQALSAYRIVRKHLVVLRVELIARGHEIGMKGSE